MDWRAVVAVVAAPCRAAGIDLVWPFALRRVNEGLAVGERLAPAGDADDLGLLIASTRYFWLRFASALQGEPERARAADPVDEHVMSAVHAAVEALAPPAIVRFAHESPPLPIQRIAELAGFARLSPARLSVHPVYGPWVALRAVVVVAVPGPAPGSLPELHDPCPGCPGGCAAVFEHALSASAERPGAATLARDWRDWLAVRDACPVGREHRYADDQIRYGYTKDRGVLDALVRA
jgi:cyanocobalamin reductase (cyanide-eliminating) / alkylcobalamin dealkylase